MKLRQTFETSSAHDSLFATLAYESCASHDYNDDADSDLAEDLADDGYDSEDQIAEGEPSLNATDTDAAWRSFLSVVVDAVDRMIQLVQRRVRGFADDVAALQHLRTVLVARLNGQIVPFRMGEMLHAVGILLATFVDKGKEDRAIEQLATPLRRMRDIAREMMSDDHARDAAPCASSRFCAAAPREPARRRSHCASSPVSR